MLKFVIMNNNKTQTIEYRDINKIKGDSFELFFNEFFNKSPNFEKNFIKKLSKKIGIKFNVNDFCQIQWKNWNKKEGVVVESMKPFDFEIDSNDKKYKFFVDVKYRTDESKFDINKEFQEMIKEKQNFFQDEQTTKGRKCFFIYVVWHPNFSNFSWRKNNLFNMNIFTFDLGLFL